MKSNVGALIIAGCLALPGAAAGKSAASPLAVLATLMASPPTHRTTVQISVDGVVLAGEPVVAEVVDESEVVEYKDGEDGVSHTRPGNHKPGKMTLSRDWANDPAFLAWRKAVLDGKVDRRSISVIFHNDAGQEAGRINLYNCWPNRWQAVADNARSSGHASEKLEISWETMELK